MNYADEAVGYPSVSSGAKTSLGANAAMQQAAFPGAISRIEMAAKRASGFGGVVMDFANRVLGEEPPNGPARIQPDRNPGHVGEMGAALANLSDALSFLESQISRLERIG